MKKSIILYVDDEPIALTSVKAGLIDRGYDVLTAETGEDAMELLKTNTPDLIIADLRMQPMNGFELFQQVKKLPTHSNVPFFFLTAVDDFLAQKYGQTIGVDAYITKPVELDSLDHLIKNKLETS
ncbi:MAG: response regulator [Bacteroidetes bacterium]|nr:response regulator [Bacteroidota bacterium]